MKNYVVYWCGMLKYEGAAKGGADYIMENGRPRFHFKIRAHDFVTIFVYETYNNHPTYIKRRDYICLDTPTGQLMRAKSRKETKF